MGLATRRTTTTANFHPVSFATGRTALLKRNGPARTSKNSAHYAPSRLDGRRSAAGFLQHRDEGSAQRHVLAQRQRQGPHTQQCPIDRRRQVGKLRARVCGRRPSTRESGRSDRKARSSAWCSRTSRRVMTCMFSNLPLGAGALSPVSLLQRVLQRFQWLHEMVARTREFLSQVLAHHPGTGPDVHQTKVGCVRKEMSDRFPSYAVPEEVLGMIDLAAKVIFERHQRDPWGGSPPTYYHPA